MHARERIAYGSDPYQFADLRVPGLPAAGLPAAGLPGPHPVAILIHGGFWRARYDLEHIGPVCEALTRAGIATWNLEYRRIGNPGGGWPGTLEDVAAGADHLHAIAGRFNLDLSRAIAVGHSAGGHLALWLGSRRKVAGVVSLAGVADLRRAWELRLSNTVVADFLGGGPDEVPERYRHASPIEQLPFGIPQKLFHGTADANVPFEIGERYVRAAVSLGDDAELIRLENSGHFELVNPATEEFGRVLDAVLALQRRL
jgi:acetyl esterase/lipase